VVVHEPERDGEHHDQEPGAEHERDAEAGRLGERAAADRAGEHRRARDHLATAEHGLELAREARGAQGVDEPGLDRAGEERVAEADQHRGRGPGGERRPDLPEEHVEERRARQRHGPEQVRRAPPEQVGDDPGRHLEQDHAGRERRVRGERLEVREPGVEQQHRVDAPDERRGERVAQLEQQVRALDGSRRGNGHLCR
jgi:hypothetical protein